MREIGQLCSPWLGFYLLLTLAKAKEMVQEVKNAEVMVNMTREAAETAVMQAMEANQRAINASSRMDQLIQVLG